MQPNERYSAYFSLRKRFVFLDRSSIRLSAFYSDFRTVPMTSTKMHEIRSVRVLHFVVVGFSGCSLHGVKNSGTCHENMAFFYEDHIGQCCHLYKWRHMPEFAINPI